MQKLDINTAVFKDVDQIIDTHVHYNLDPFYQDWQTYWQQAQAKGVRQSVIPGVDIESSLRGVDIASQDPNLWALVGVHPSEAGKPKFKMEHLQELAELVVQPTVLGIGEIGLDYYWLQSNDAESRQRQRHWLREQLQLAQKHGGWISLHVRDQLIPEQKQPGNAYWDTLQVIQEFDWDPSHNQLILHCVSGPKRYVQEMLEIGAYVGFDGNLTYPNAEELRQLWQLVPADQRLLETDAPYLPPQQFRGETCEPWMISLTARYVQEKLLAVS